MIGINGLSINGKVGQSSVAAFNPASITGMLAWWKSDAGVLNGSDLPAANTDAIKTWQDQSGNARHLQQPTAGNRPTYHTALYNKPVLNFEDTPGDFLITTTTQPSDTVPYTIFLLWAPKTGINNASIIFNTSQSGLGSFFIEDGGVDTFSLNAGASVLGSAYALNSFAYSAVIFNGASSKHFKNGTQIGTTANPGTRTLAGFCLGSYITGSDPSEMYVAECIIFNSEISGTNLTNMHSYLASRTPA